MMVKNQNTFAKRQREMAQRQRAADKRAKRRHRKDAPLPRGDEIESGTTASQTPFDGETLTP